MTEQHAQLPDGWEWKTLGDLVKLKNGFAFKSTDYCDDGIPIVRISDLDGESVSLTRSVKVSKESFSSNFLIEKGDLLIAMSGATTGKIGVYKSSEQAMQNQRVGNLKIADEALLNAKYRDFYIFFIKPQIEKAAYGGAQPNISAKLIEAFPIPVPEVEQQKQIVAKIEELFSHIDAGIESLQTAKAKLKQYRQSVLKAAVTGELTKEWRAENASKIEPADQLLKRIQTERRQRWEQQQLEQFQAKGKMPKNDKWKQKYKEPESFGGAWSVPENWSVVSFDQLGHWSGGGTPSKSKVEFWSNGEILWITPKDMKSDYLDNSIDKITEVAVQKSTAKLIPENSLLFVVRSGILRRILPTGLTKRETTVNQDIKALTFSVEELSEYFLICAKALEENIRRECMKGGTTVESIEMPKLLGYFLPLPPLEEQKEIVRMVEEKLTVADRLMQELDTKLTQAQQQKQTILASAFKGELLS